MSTSERSIPVNPADDALLTPGSDVASTVAREIERLANEFFAAAPGVGFGGPPGVSAGLPAGVPPSFAPSTTSPAVDASPVAGSSGAVAPPRFGPSALGVGGGGASPSVGWPPVPGPLKQPPLSTAPPPRESDLRAIPTLLSDNLGLPSRIALASTPDPSPPALYFLSLAGLPASSPPASPSGVTPLPGGFPGAASPFAPPGPVAPPAALAPPAPASAPPVSVPVSSTPVSSTDGYSVDPELVPRLEAAPGLLDPNTIRRDFPILQERVHGRRLVWLDNGATTQKPQAVIDRVSYFYEHENSNVHRGAHVLAARATDAYEAARDKVRRFINAPSAKEIVFVRGTTEGINLVAQSWGRRNIGAGDEIVITWLEHHANIVPWQQLCSEKGARLRVAPVDDRGQVILDDYERLLGPRTRLVSFTQVSNALGTIVPAKAMVEMAHRHGALVHVDGAQAVSHMPVDVQALDCDFYTFSGHKVFAPTGIGVVFGKIDLLETMPPWQGGGNMIADVTFERTTYQPAPGRFEAGTGNIADAVGLGAALDYVSAIGLDNISRYEHDLLVYGTERLLKVPGLRMIGTAAEKAGVMSFVIDGFRTEDVGGALDQEGIAVRSGHHCAQPILRRFGVEATVRATLAPYNTVDDIDALVRALLRLSAGRPSGDF